MKDDRLREINDFLNNLVAKQKEIIDKQEKEIEQLKARIKILEVVERLYL